MARIENPDTLIFSIRKAVQTEADRLREEYIALAIQEYEKKLRERIALAVIDVSNYFFIERVGKDLRISVRYE